MGIVLTKSRDLLCDRFSWESGGGSAVDVVIGWAIEMMSGENCQLLNVFDLALFVNQLLSAVSSISSPSSIAVIHREGSSISARRSIARASADCRPELELLLSFFTNAERES